MIAESGIDWLLTSDLLFLFPKRVWGELLHSDDAAIFLKIILHGNRVNFYFSLLDLLYAV